MANRSGFEGVYRSADSPKRRQEVLDRLAWGMDVKQIAADLGISRGAAAAMVEQLRSEGRPGAATDAGST